MLESVAVVVYDPKALINELGRHQLGPQVQVADIHRVGKELHARTILPSWLKLVLSLMRFSCTKQANSQRIQGHLT